MQEQRMLVSDSATALACTLSMDRTRSAELVLEFDNVATLDTSSKNSIRPDCAELT
jgi:hypothetical protein